MKYILFFTISAFAFLASGQTEVSETAIKEALLEVAGKHNLTAGDMEEYRISDRYVHKSTGATHVYLLQTIHGMDVFNAQVQLHFSKKGKLVFSNSTFIKDKNTKWSASAASMEVKPAFLPVLDMLHIAEASLERIGLDSDTLGNLTLINSNLFFQPVRVKLGYETVSDKLVLVYQFVVEPRSDHKTYVVKVDATTGKIVRIINRTLECHFEHTGQQDQCMLSVPFPDFSGGASVTPKSGASYNAFPLGVESPIHGSRAILTNIENAAASPFGWHDTDGIQGADYFTTKGNNVFAYEDTSNLDAAGYSPDGGPTLNFDFPLDLSLLPAQNMDAALTNMFVWNNFMHDVTYHYGFDEESGNFQVNNYEKGGIGGDAVLAEGLDGGGLNNANFTVSEDGNNPKMQMYIWQHGTDTLLTLHSPSNISGPYATAIPPFGLEGIFPSVTANIVLINSGGSHPSQGCAAPMDDLTGKIAMIEMGNCSFIEKVMNAQQAGAVGVIIVNEYDMTLPFMWGNDDGMIVIPVIGVGLETGFRIKIALESGVVSATLGGDVANLDSDFDNGIISHEYAHGVSTRLTGGPSQPDCLLNDEQAGEGWSDFLALVMTSTPANTADQPRGIGNYSTNRTFDGPGIRDYPYSRDMAINPVTYGDLFALTAPHGSGSVWGSMLWDLYWTMIDQYGNSNDLYATDGGNNKTIRLAMEGMRLQSCMPGFVDSRNAILAADELLFDGVNSCLIWKVFARRGLGYSADQGSSSVVGDETEAFDLPSACLGIDVGMAEVSLSDFRIYPVPASDVLKVSNTKGATIDELIVFDLSGKEISRKHPDGIEGQIDVSGLTAGIYLLQIRTGDTSFQKRFVIMD